MTQSVVRMFGAESMSCPKSLTLFSPCSNNGGKFLLVKEDKCHCNNALIEIFHISKQYKTENAQISNNDEYLLFQTLIGAWPYSAGELTQGKATFINRIKDYMIKAIKEAKVE